MRSPWIAAAGHRIAADTDKFDDAYPAVRMAIAALPSDPASSRPAPKEKS
jgi:hypothetical protein